MTPMDRHRPLRAVAATILAAAAIGTLLLTGTVAQAATPADCSRPQQAVRQVDPRLARTDPREYARQVRQAAQNAARICAEAYRPTTTTPRPTTTTPRPTTTTPRPTTTTPPPTGTSTTVRCDVGTTMTYGYTPLSGQQFICNGPYDSLGSDYYSYDGQINFVGTIRVSVTCPTGRFQASRLGATQGSVSGDYYVPERSADGRTVSYFFYSGNDTGRNARAIVSGECRSALETATEVEPS